MCEFFSFSTNAKGEYFYFKPEDIKKIRTEGNPKNLDFNSHTSIAEYYFGDSKLEDKHNKYEYNPFTEEFKIDYINLLDDSLQAKLWVENLFNKFKTKKDLINFYQNYIEQVDYKQLEKNLGNIPTKIDVINLIKRIEKIEWFKPQKQPIKAKLQLKIDSILKAFKLDFKAELQINSLKTKKDWASAWASAWDSAWDSARDSAWDSARASAWASARDSAWDSEFEVVKNLMKKKGYKTNPFKKLLELWEMGLYPIGVLKDKKFHIYYVPLNKNVIQTKKVV